MVAGQASNRAIWVVRIKRGCAQSSPSITFSPSPGGNEVVLLDVLVEVEVLLDNGEKLVGWWWASVAVIVEVDVVVLMTMVVTCTEVVCGQRDQARVDARDERFRPQIIPHETPCGC
eukprot:1298998-Amphidinium_carterae.2